MKTLYTNKDIDLTIKLFASKLLITWGDVEFIGDDISHFYKFFTGFESMYPYKTILEINTTLFAKLEKLGYRWLAY